MCHVPSQPPPHRLAPRAPIASSTLENQAGIARICTHHRASRGSNQHPGHGQGTERSREGLDLSSGSRVPSRVSQEEPCCFPASLGACSRLPHACPSPCAPAGGETLPRAGTSSAEPTTSEHKRWSFMQQPQHRATSSHPPRALVLLLPAPRQEKL